MAYPIVSLVIAVLVGFLAFSTMRTDKQISNSTPASEESAGTPAADKPAAEEPEVEISE